MELPPAPTRSNRLKSNGQEGARAGTPSRAVGSGALDQEQGRHTMKGRVGNRKKQGTCIEQPERPQDLKTYGGPVSRGIKVEPQSPLHDSQILKRAAGDTRKQIPDGADQLVMEPQAKTDRPAEKRTTFQTEQGNIVVERKGDTEN
jgi:hypothetical protein